MELTLEQGEYLVRLARRVVETYLSTGERIDLREPPDWTRDERGVFVTLRKVVPGRGHELRGCIGYPEPVMPLHKALISAALASALEDPRFPEVRLQEMDSITVEVSVLTKPKRIEVVDRSSVRSHLGARLKE
ncbi:MAG: TIGR00296 family protein [Candidatus Bathyarchaeia archaeon]